MSDFEGILKKYKRTSYQYVVTLYQCDKYTDFDHPGTNRDVCTRVFATREEARTFVRNSIMPLVKHRLGELDNQVEDDEEDDEEEDDEEEDDEEKDEEMDLLARALHHCFPDLSENDGETSTISFDIDEQCLTADVSPFQFKPVSLFKRRHR